MEIDQDILKTMKSVVEGLRTDRLPWWVAWREIADYYLPQRYVYLMSSAESRANRTQRNPFILDGTGTMAARTLASGMMNGITSPSRPWLRLGIAGQKREELSRDALIWLDDVTLRMLLIMAGTNFYNAMATMYLDLSVFGTAACIIYEDFHDVFRCYSSPLGEFYLGQSDRQTINIVAREFTYKVRQVVEWFEEENCSQAVKDSWKAGGARWNQDVDIVHLIEPNYDTKGKLPGKFKFRETYWEKASTETAQVLSRRGYYEMPGIFPRWELTSNDSYGTSPGMDALGDVIQLQHETKKKGQGLDKLIVPRGITYVAGVNNVGVKPAYQINMPLNDLSVDIAQVQQRIKEIFHNDLFRMISNLDTVRSATEIDARREEKLVLLGPVLERFENEALSPAVRRIYSIVNRAGLLPPPPPEISNMEIEIQYTSILTAAQTAVATIPIERWIGLIGSVAGVRPDVLNVPDWDETIRYYGQQLGVPAKLAVPKEESIQVTNQQHQTAQLQQAVATGGGLAEGAKTLSETDVGGGANALSQLINPYGG
jgi:hypothetical protein